MDDRYSEKIAGVDYDNLHSVWNNAHQAGSPIKYIRDRVVYRALRALTAGDTLEAGCGCGAYSLYLASLKHQVDAFDPSIFAIVNLSKSIGGPSVNVFQCTFDTFFPDKMYDNVICIEVLEHIKEDNIALSKLVSCLKSGGQMIISVPACPYLYGYADEKAGHYRRYKKNDLHNLLVNAGLCDFRIISYGFPVLYLYTFLRKFIFKEWMNERFQKRNASSYKPQKNSIMSEFYGLILTVDCLNIPFGSVGYVAICRK